MVWGRKKTPPAVDKPRWNQDDYHKEFAGKLKEQIEAGRRAVAETVEARREPPPEEHPNRQAVPGR